ncbi:MAG TPA: EB domain-containing protein [Polyangiaceae bacterium]|nr:EB domain-containing protein [Polyangiaceae bacterium]
MFRYTMARVLLGLSGGLGVCCLAGCSDTDTTYASTPGLAELSVPLSVEAEGIRYRLAGARIEVSGASEASLYGSDDPDESVLAAMLPVGEYTSELVAWRLERDDGSGRFQPVVAELVSSAQHTFRLLNGSTETISYRFETDGHLVTIGNGTVVVTIDVQRRAGACTPLGSDCEEGQWCPPSELMGAPVACVAAGVVPLGEACRSPSECVANASCIDFGQGSVCTALCDATEFGNACDGGGSCRPKGTDYGECQPEGAELGCPVARARWETAGAMDAVFDVQRCQLYATQGNTIVKHDLRSGTVEPLVELDGLLLGLDLSPDESTLIVADASADVETASNRVHLVDVATGAARRLEFPLDFMEVGTFMPVFLDATSALVTSSFAGSGWVPLRRVDLSSGAFEVLRSVRQDSMLARSADGSTVAWAEANSSNGPFGRYSVADGSMSGGETWAFVDTIAVNRDGTRYAVPVFMGLRLFESSGPTSGFVEAARLDRGGASALGAAFAPDRDVLYVSWSGGPSSLEAIDTRSFETLFTIDAGLGFGFGSGGLGSGRVKVSSDGRVLMAITDGAIMTYPVRFD